MTQGDPSSSTARAPSPPDTPVGLTCRRYRTGDTVEGAVVWAGLGGVPGHGPQRVRAVGAQPVPGRGAGAQGLGRPASRLVGRRPRRGAGGCSRGAHPRAGAYAQAFGRDDLDASALMLAVFGFLPATDARMAATIDAIATRLTDQHGFVFGYRSDDGLDGGEGTFAICTCWLVRCLAVAGAGPQRPGRRLWWWSWPLPGSVTTAIRPPIDATGRPRGRSADVRPAVAATASSTATPRRDHCTPSTRPDVP